MLDSIALKFVGVCRAEDLVARDLRGDDLADNILVCEADNEAIFGSVVFVLCLGDETLAGVVVGLPCSTTLVLGLVAATLLSVASCFSITSIEYLPIVRAIFDQLGERLFENPESAIRASDSIPKHLAETQFHRCEEHRRLEYKTYHAESCAFLSLSSCQLWLCRVLRSELAEKCLCAPDLACVRRWVTSLA